MRPGAAGVDTSGESAHPAAGERERTLASRGQEKGRSVVEWFPVGPGRRLLVGVLEGRRLAVDPLSLGQVSVDELDMRVDYRRVVGRPVEQFVRRRLQGMQTVAPGQVDQLIVATASLDDSHRQKPNTDPRSPPPGTRIGCLLAAPDRQRIGGKGVGITQSTAMSTCACSRGAAGQRLFERSGRQLPRPAGRFPGPRRPGARRPPRRRGGAGRARRLQRRHDPPRRFDRPRRLPAPRHARPSLRADYPQVGDEVEIAASDEILRRPLAGHCSPSAARLRPRAESSSSHVLPTTWVPPSPACFASSMAAPAPLRLRGCLRPAPAGGARRPGAARHRAGRRWEPAEPPPLSRCAGRRRLPASRRRGGRGRPPESFRLAGRPPLDHLHRLPRRTAFLGDGLHQSHRCATNADYVTAQATGTERGHLELQPAHLTGAHARQADAFARVIGLPGLRLPGWGARGRHRAHRRDAAGFDEAGPRPTFIEFPPALSLSAPPARGCTRTPNA